MSTKQGFCLVAMLRLLSAVSLLLGSPGSKVPGQFPMFTRAPELGSVVMVHGLSCSMAWDFPGPRGKIFHSAGNFFTMSHQGRPGNAFKETFISSGRHSECGH